MKERRSGGKDVRLSFEEAAARLEEIVKALETGELSLDESLELFAEGVRLTQHCSDLLGQAEQRIEKLIKGEGGTVRLEQAMLEEEGA